MRPRLTHSYVSARLKPKFAPYLAYIWQIYEFGGYLTRVDWLVADMSGVKKKPAAVE